MVAEGMLGSDQEAILCHRAANVMLDTVLVQGHATVTSAVAAHNVPHMSLLPDRRGVETSTESVVHVYGNFLADCAASRCVDWERCTSNDIWEVYNLLGVEACAHVLFEQLKLVISFDGQYVDDRHLMLIVESICRTGRLVPLNRHGINRSDTSPLMQCSFEETLDVLFEASGWSKAENARGVTTSIMTGQQGFFGSGVADVLFHERCLAKSAPPPPMPAQSVPRVMRSTCRVHTRRPDDVAHVEYTLDACHAATATWPPFSSATRPRVPFRPASPEP